MTLFKNLLLVSSVIVLSAGFMAESVQAADPEADGGRICAKRGLRFTDLEPAYSEGCRTIEPIEAEARGGGLRDTGQYSNLGVGQFPAAPAVFPHTDKMPPICCFAGKSADPAFIGLNEYLVSRRFCNDNVTITGFCVAQSNGWDAATKRTLRPHGWMFPVPEPRDASHKNYKRKVNTAVFCLSPEDPYIIPGTKRGRPYQWVDYSVHNQKGGGPLVSSGAHPEVHGIEDGTQSHFFHSVFIDGDNIAITLQALLNPDDFEIVQRSADRYEALIELIGQRPQYAEFAGRMREAHVKKLVEEYGIGAGYEELGVAAAAGAVVDEGDMIDNLTPLGVSRSVLNDMAPEDITELYKDLAFQHVNPEAVLVEELNHLQGFGMKTDILSAIQNAQVDVMISAAAVARSE